MTEFGLVAARFGEWTVSRLPLKWRFPEADSDDCPLGVPEFIGKTSVRYCRSLTVSARAQARLEQSFAPVRL